ncbi:unnamed protein product, partial [Cyprideis torosa]
FAKAGASFITFHPEASDHVDRSLSLIRESGCKSGLVFNPATPLSYLDYVMDKVDVVLLMSVNPGFGGQKFIPATLDKLRQARKMIDDSGYDIRLEIDGGVKVDNIREIREAGADMFVAGSAIFGAAQASDPNGYDTVVNAMRAELEKAARVPDLAFCVDEMMKALGMPVRGEASVRQWVGNGVPKLVERALTNEMEGVPDAQLYEKAYPIFLDLYADNTSKRSCLYDGVREGLDYLESEGYRIGCVTNKAARFTMPLLTDLGIIDEFEIILAGD